MEGLKKINSAYKDALLFDGFYNEERVELNQYRHQFNSFIRLVARFIFLIHLVIFITDNERLKNELIYFKLSDDFGSKYLNLGMFLIGFKLLELTKLSSNFF